MANHILIGHNIDQIPGPNMSQSRAREILRTIVPWALEGASPKFRTNYKGVRGRICIVGGARDYAGAPYFASVAAMRLGADLAYVLCSSLAAPAIKNYSPDLIVTPLLDCPNESEFAEEIGCLLDRMHAVVVGPGLGREKLLLARAKILINEAKARSLPLVLDADSLILVNENPSIIQSYPKAILTPNRIELQRILNSLYAPKTHDLRNMPTSEISKLVGQCSKDLNVCILAKGMVDIISDSGQLQLSTDEHSGSSRRCGGQGDVLAGMAGVYLHWMEQNNRDTSGQRQLIERPTLWAGYLAAITTRLCNEIAFKEFRHGMLVSDIVKEIPTGFESLLQLERIHQIERKESETIKTEFKYTGLMKQDEIKRYTRQMIMDEFGPERQINLKRSSALIIGAGGLGCPAAIYLGAAGIGRLGVVDDDIVEESNLHRQILHNMKKIGMLKTESIREAVFDINPNVQFDSHACKLTRHNAVSLIEKYDMVIDATDNLTTRYLINDACVVAKKPLVSGAALGMNGQLTVYNYDDDTPCFRCLFPEPPPASSVGSCSENGVLGIIPGIIGVQQALEAIKIGAGIKPANAGKMLLFDGKLGLFRHVTLNKRKAQCEACGPDSKLDRNLIDYDKFCNPRVCEQPAPAGGQAPDILKPAERITVEEYRDILISKKAHVLVDVRPLPHSAVSRFEHAIAIPVLKLLKDRDQSLALILGELNSKGTEEVYVVCRKGIASQRGTRIIQEMFEEEKRQVSVKDIIGGMTTWAKRIDPNYSCL